MQNPNESHRADSSSNPSNVSDHELYNIPRHSSWFSWDEIHQIERIAHGEFFNNLNISKTPKIYKEYRDFIINKYREDPSRRLTFAQVRKCLIGDVGTLHKIFRFLENWGLINFGLHPLDGDRNSTAENDAALRKVRVVIEEGAPTGIRVAEFPNSIKMLAAPTPAGSGCEEVGADGFRLPPLASYSDVFGDGGRKKGCWNCGADCVSGYYESVKQGGSVICAKCFKDGNYEERKLADDFKFVDVDGTSNSGIDVWTEGETSLLLEAVTKHGDDWGLVEQHIRTKTKLDCISRLIQLPLGEDLKRSSIVNGDDTNSIKCTNDAKETETETTAVVDPQNEPPALEDEHGECIVDGTVAAVHNEDGEISDPPLKRRCITSFADAGNSLMKQVAYLSTIAGPHVAAAAAEAAVASLCNENPCARKFYEAVEDDIRHNLGFPISNNETARDIEGEDTMVEVKHKQSDENGPSTLQIRVAIATALGAVAAHSKLLADQEQSEMEHLMATIIETQLRKMACKIKHFEELQLIMEKEYSQVQQLKETILSDHINVLQQAFNAGISRWKDHNAKPSAATSLL